MKDTGGPAFPVVEIHPVHGSRIDLGMTLLDWFAGQALCGLLSDHTIERVTPEGYAQSAYDYAEAMIAERMKR